MSQNATNLEKEDPIKKSPLRRSVRLSNNHTLAPSRILTRRTSATETSTVTPRATRSRRLSYTEESATQKKEAEIKSKKSAGKTFLAEDSGSSLKANYDEKMSLIQKYSQEETVKKSGDKNSLAGKEQVQETKIPISTRRSSVTQGVEINEDQKFTTRITRSRSASTAKAITEEKQLTVKLEKVSDLCLEQVRITDPQIDLPICITNNSDTLSPIKEGNEDEETSSMNESKINSARSRKADVANVELDLNIINEISLTEEVVTVKAERQGLSQECVNRSESFPNEKSEKNNKENISPQKKCETSGVLLNYEDEIVNVFGEKLSTSTINKLDSKLIHVDDSQSATSAVNSISLPDTAKPEVKIKTLEKSVNSMKVQEVGNNVEVIEKINDTAANEEIHLSCEKQNEDKITPDYCLETHHNVSADEIITCKEERENSNLIMENNIIDKVDFTNRSDDSLKTHVCVANSEKELEVSNFSTEINLKEDSKKSIQNNVSISKVMDDESNVNLNIGNALKQLNALNNSDLINETDSTKEINLNESEIVTRIDKSVDLEKTTEKNRKETDNGKVENCEITKDDVENGSCLEVSEEETNKEVKRKYPKQNVTSAEKRVRIVKKHITEGREGNLDESFSNLNLPNNLRKETKALKKQQFRHTLSEINEAKKNNDINEIPPGHEKKTPSKSENKVQEENDIDSKIDELLLGTFNTSSGESEDERNSLFNLMAEEGEEDTPSEGSNEIVEVGEEINTTESELSTDESYDDDDSFINDEEPCQLLSGEEYDLSLEHPKRKSRIIQLSSGSDDEIIKIHKPEKKKQEKVRKSRILKFQDSSDEEIVECLTESEIAQKQDQECTFDTPEKHDGQCEVKTNEVKEENHNTPAKEIPLPTIIELDFQQKESFKSVSSTPNPEKELNICTIQNKEIEHNLDIVGSENSHHNLKETLTLPVIDGVKQQTFTKKIIIHENVKVQDIQNKRLSDQINQVIDSLCSEIKNTSEISINVSLDYTETLSDLDQNSCKSDQPEHPRKLDNFSEDNTVEQKPNSRAPIKRSDDAEIINRNEIIVMKKMKKDIQKNSKNRKDSCTKSSDIKLPYENESETKYKTKNGDREKIKRPKSFFTDTFVMSNNIEDENSVHQKNKKLTKYALLNQISPKLPKKVKITKIEQQNTEFYVPAMQGKKRKHSNLEMPKKNIKQSSEDQINEVFISKKRKRNRSKTKQVPVETMTLNILDEAVVDDRRRRLPLLQTTSSLGEEWTVQRAIIKPSRANKTQLNNMEYIKMLKCSKSEHSPVVKDFHTKDFKNKMLYDSTRAKRIDTKQILQKKRINT